MSDSTASINESMIWCAKTGELQSLKTLLKEVIDQELIYIIDDFVYLASGESKRTNEWSIIITLRG